jgi:hypothetical protein
MKFQSQALVLALALSISVMLALVVALACVSYFHGSPPLPDVDTAETLSDTAAEETDTETELTETETETETAPPQLSAGLQFVSNGDGSCKVVGMGNCTDACVTIPSYSPAGDRVTEIADRAFYGYTTLTAVQIPASVQHIGNLAFAACDNLLHIAVSSENTVYRDVEGVLYTADMRVLLQYPAMRAGNTVTIDQKTVEIAEMAFYRCVYLTTVRYTGSPEEWESIRIAAKNYSLTAASKIFLEA